MENKYQSLYQFQTNPYQISQKHTPDFHRVSSRNPVKWKNHQRENPFLPHGHRYKFYNPLFFLFQFLIFVAFLVSCQASDGVIVTQSDFQSLKAIKHELVDFRGVLRSWNDSGNGACSGGWAGIKCVQGQVIAIQLPWKGLGGRISEKISELQSLRKISLHDNVLSGAVPTSLGLLHNLRGIYLFNNRFSGSVPPSIGKCPLLQTLDLSSNLLTGSIPPSLANSTKIYRLNLSFNSFTGSIPVKFTQSPSLVFLSLQHNNLSGSIPDTWGVGGGTGNNNTYQLQILTLDHNLFSGTIPKSLTNLDSLEVISLSHNQLNGSIPIDSGRLSRLRMLDLSNNVINGSFPNSLSNLSSLVTLNLEGNRLNNQIPEYIVGLQNLSVLNLKRNQFTGHIPATISKISSITQLDLSENAFTGEISGSFAELPNLNSFNVSYNNLSGSVPILLSKKFNSSSFVGNLQLCGYSISTPCPSPPPENISLPPPLTAQKHHHRKLSTKDIILIAAGVVLAVLLLVCCILLCCLLKKRAASRKKNGKSSRSVVAGGVGKSVPAAAPAGAESGEVGGKLVHFDGPFVFTADDLLCATAEIMGKSSYGTAYKATLEDGNQIAVKRLREKNTKSQKEFEIEASALEKIRHPNILTLRAYYLGPKGEKLLVFDYMPRGSLASFLHARGPEIFINWPARMNIAIGVTRGLCYLHTQENIIIHGNLTSSNILLDEQSNPHIADVGLSRLMTAAAANTNVIATAGATGYRAPELTKLKKANTKTDVYSLGVIILELLTGKSPSDGVNGMDLPQWVASIVKEEWTNEVFDLELLKDDSTTIGDELLNTLKLAMHCVDPSPEARPDVQQVLQQLEEIKPELAASTSEEAGAGAAVSPNINEMNII